MMFHGYEIIVDWKNSTNGKIAVGKKGSKKYFIKQYQTPVKPINNGALDIKTIKHNEKVFKDFVELRTSINKAIRSVSSEGGNIIVPFEEFIEGNHFVEVSEFIEGAIPEAEMESVLSSLSMDVKKMMMLTAAGALASIHKQGIIHSDLKLPNILLARNSFGNFVTKIIDFDSSYFQGHAPLEVIGTIDYYSPELGEYSDNEDERETLGNKITCKSDIFSLALIYHYILTGTFPVATNLHKNERLSKRAAKGKRIYCWVALNGGCDIELSPEIKNPDYVSLISDMLNIDPDKRPSAIEVLKRLKENTVGFEEPFPEHKIILKKDKLEAKLYIGLKKIVVDDQKKYELLSNTGMRSVLSKEELVSNGLAQIVIEGFCEPWPEHKIDFDQKFCEERGYVAAERIERTGVKGYNLLRTDGGTKFITEVNLILMKYAIKRVPKVVVDEIFDDPWPEHEMKLDVSVLKSKGYLSVKRVNKDGIKGYIVTDRKGTKRFIRKEMMIVQKFASKCG